MKVPRYDTDALVLTARILRELQSSATPDGTGCLIYPFTHIECERRSHIHGRGSTTIPIGVAVYAITHPHDHVTPEEHVIASCGHLRCMTPEHLGKGDPPPRVHEPTPCTRTVPGIVRRDGGKGFAHMSKQPRDLTAFTLPPAALAAILDTTFSSRGCRFYDGLMVRLSDGTPVSVARLVYALAHPDDAPSAEEIVVHTCDGCDPDNADPSRLICVEPSHLAKRRLGLPAPLATSANYPGLTVKRTLGMSVTL